VTDGNKYVKGIPKVSYRKNLSCKSEFRIFPKSYFGAIYLNVIVRI